MVNTMCNVATATKNVSDTLLAMPQLPIGSTITNLVVDSLNNSLSFYNNVLDMDIVQYSSRCAVISNGAMTICLATKEYANEVFGFTMPKLNSNYTPRDLTTTVVCEDVWAVWSAAMAFGATSVRKPVTTEDNVTCAVLQDLNNYTIVLKSSM